ncbi:MAG: peptidoglycan editing factor PgeF [Burkholderiales bacterium]|nr:peptidoglycan editing factor PgeF [Burkholderiales bacterium]
MTTEPIAFIAPDWPAPTRVRALITTRAGGVSGGPYAALNLGDHVGDEPAAVAQNRACLAAYLPAAPLWLRQVHGTAVADALRDRPGCEADASFTHTPGRVLAVLTADCLPVLLAEETGAAVAIAHAGWRGLATGVIERTVAALGTEPANLLAYLGPAIGPHAFEVGNDVRDAFVRTDAQAAAAFQPTPSGKWLADLYALARLRLAKIGTSHVYGGDFCTFGDASRFYSYRRDGVTGRMASLIWLEP